MGRKVLLPDVVEVTLKCMETTGTGGIVMVLQTAREQVGCPCCGSGSRRVHSRYLRTVADLPWEGVAVTIRLQTRKFFCVTDKCPMRIFTEPLPNTVGRYARRTRRAAEVLGWITLALGGEAGARLAQRLGLFAAGSTLLRHVRHRAKPSFEAAPRVLGIDDWAWRKGHRYGTILCDLEQRRVIDLLPDREAETVEKWLRAHPGTEIVSRDRASAYADAVRRAAPHAVQVADRWHLLRNLSEALRQALEPHHSTLTLAAQAAGNAQAAALPVQTKADSYTVPALTQAIRTKQQNRERRHARYESVMELAQRGVAKKQIARQLGLDRRTIRRWIGAGMFPERRPVYRRSSVDAHVGYLDLRWQQGLS
jgi:transposase